MKEKMPYEMPEMIVMMMACEDIITSSFIDNDGDYRDWVTDDQGW